MKSLSDHKILGFLFLGKILEIGQEENGENSAFSWLRTLLINFMGIGVSFREASLFIVIYFRIFWVLIYIS